ncbi:MAG: cupin domain-containing protein [Bryobacterales bacterium]
MQVHRWTSIDHEVMSPKIARRVIHSERMTTARIYLEKGGVVPRHSHDNEQISHVIEGRLLFEFDDQSFEVGAGEVMEIAPNEPHKVTALEDSMAMDVFGPVRTDWLSGDDAYLRNPSEGS